ncbi:Translation factor pelota [Gurleya vavrai]
MKIFKQKIDYKSKEGFLDLIPESNDDIYTLYNIIEQKDMIKSKTQRKVLIANNTQQKVTVLLEIIVESVSVDLEAGFLFIKGKTIHDYEHIRKGSYHTIEISLNHRFSIFKNEWTELSIQNIKKINNNEKGLLFIYITTKEFSFCEVSAYAIKIKDKKEYKGKNFKEILKYSDILMQNEYSLIILAFSNNIDKEFEKQFKNTYKKLENKICTVKIDCASKNIYKIIEETISDPETNKKFLNIQFLADINEFTIFEKNMLKNNLICIGIKEVEEAIDYGAIKSIIVTNELFKSFDPETRKKIEKLCKSIKNLGGKIFIIPIMHNAGEKLQTMGGIVGNLKFEYKD